MTHTLTANAAQGYGYGAPPSQPGNSMATILNNQDSFSAAVAAAQQQQQQQGQAQQQNGANGAAGGTQAGQASLVGDEEYNRLLKNYKLAHLRIEEQRSAMLEQEKQNAGLRKHIMLLEGGDSGGATVIGVHSAGGGGGSTVDDFTIKNSSSSLERRINRWAADTLASHVRSAPPPPASSSAPASQFAHLALIPLAEALFQDVENATASPFLVGLSQMGFDYPGLGIVVQSLLRHVMSQLLCEGIVNKLLVTNSEEANQELTKLHEQLFHREPLVASVWRRQTFSAAVDSLDPEMSLSLFREHMPHVFSLINPGSPTTIAPELETVLDASYLYSRMLHKSYSPGGALEGSGFYRSFVCQVGSPLDPTQLELIKKCYRTERGEPERVGACLFPGLVKETAVDTTPLPHISIRHGPGAYNARTIQKKRETRTLVVRRAQVICECALAAAHGIATMPRSAPSAVTDPAFAGQPR
ncbi:hypothetical protein JCM10908_000759 [Rhodotorula pacifica]|uniref:uncharacterized protein n=1 Tax=Rhodotorula pacifica TaxID=1495444 RepID=UPI00316C295B